MKESLKVKKSSIHGKGLFSTKRIPKGTVIGICDTKPTVQAGYHTLWLEDDKQVDVTCVLKFINHSKKPNVVYYEDLSVVSLKTINAGDELLHDYGEEWD